MNRMVISSKLNEESKFYLTKAKIKKKKKLTL